MPDHNERQADLSQDENSADDSSLFISVHADIVYDTSISSNALRAFLIISGFLRKSGYAFCSDKWIAEKMNLKERVIGDYLNELEEKGYIIRETYNVGFKRKRKIWNPQEYERKSKNVAQAVQTCGNDGDQTCAPETAQTCGCNSISNINNLSPPLSSSLRSEERSPQRGERVQSIPKRKKETMKKELIERRFDVHTTEQEHQELVKKYGQDMVEKFYDKLQEWKERTPKSKWKKGDYRSILVWVIKAVQERSSPKISQNTMEDFEINKALAEKWDTLSRKMGSTYYSIEAKNDEIWFIFPVEEKSYCVTYKKTSEDFKRSCEPALKAFRLWN